MSYESGAGRWWENYLVRYFMPSIAGIAIVSWLTSVGGNDFKDALFFGSASESFDTPALTLLILYGNLFCYVASYPILCFHSTRVIDFKGYSWRFGILDGYLLTASIALLVAISTLTLSGMTLVATLFILVASFSSAQILRIRGSLATPRITGYTKRRTSLTYAYLMVLSKRRGELPEKVVTTVQSAPDEDDEGEQPETISMHEESRWRNEFMDSYKHMREHGNSAFIFVLELVLAGVCYGIIQAFPCDSQMAISVIAVAMLVWSLPSALIHLLGQHLERRFSMFDGRL